MYKLVLIVIISICSTFLQIDANPLSSRTTLNCYDDKKYYITATIVNHNVLYIVNGTETFEFDYPPFYENYLRLVKNPNNHNITFHGIVVLEYHILTPCYYICNMELIADTKNTQIIAKHFETYFNIGKTLHMMCNSSGCNWGGINCKTIEYHDEL